MMTHYSAFKNYCRDLDASHEEEIGTAWPSGNKQLETGQKGFLLKPLSRLVCQCLTKLNVHTSFGQAISLLEK